MSKRNPRHDSVGLLSKIGWSKRLIWGRNQSSRREHRMVVFIPIDRIREVRMRERERAGRGVEAEEFLFFINSGQWAWTWIWSGSGACACWSLDFGFRDSLLPCSQFIHRLASGFLSTLLFFWFSCGLAVIRLSLLVFLRFGGDYVVPNISASVKDIE